MKNSNEAKATPRPWTTDRASTEDEATKFIVSSFDLVEEIAICNKPANASLIVKAVNNHDSLLLALKGMVEQLEYVLETKNTMGCYSQLEHARQAIANAEGETK